jgi:hypothetical protein
LKSPSQQLPIFVPDTFNPEQDASNRTALMMGMSFLIITEALLS